MCYQSSNEEEKVFHVEGGTKAGTLIFWSSQIFSSKKCKSYLNPGFLLKYFLLFNYYPGTLHDILP